MVHKSLSDKMEEVKHRKLDLYEGDDPPEASPHRPDLSVWAECEIGDPPHVALGIGALWGQPQRFVDLTPGEAKRLATALLHIANTIEEIVDNHEPPDPPGFEGGFAKNH